jgi:tRNA pseudouridine38-40 synthase
VHASYFVAHFDTEKRDQLMAKSFLHRINGMLHPDIAVHRIWEVDENAHARFDALTRTYLYQIHQVKDPFINDVSHYYHGNLDLEAMNKAAAILTQTTDFKSFSKQHTDVKTYICRIEEACWEQKGSRLIFTIRADRFLRNMVRAIVGTLLDIGKESISQETFADIISSKDRSRAGMSAPAHGLILHSITYPERIMTG